MYGYVGNNPLTFIDPSGLIRDCPGGTVVNNECIQQPPYVIPPWDCRDLINSGNGYCPLPGQGPREGPQQPPPPPPPPTKPPQPPTSRCNDKNNNRSRFFQQVPGIVDMAKQLNIPNNYLVGLASYESGWLDDHDFKLNNLWGLTQAGGNNIQFSSFKAGNDYFARRVGPYIQGSAGVPDFFAGLKKEGYNSANPNYFSEDPNKGMLFNRISNIGKWAQACGATF